MKFPIPQDWDGLSWCRWAVCWPESEQWEGLLRGFLTLPQRGRTWDERSGVITDVQLTGKEITARNVPLVGVIMACNDTEMVAAWNNIADSIRYLADRQFQKPICCEGGIVVTPSAGYAGSVVQPVGGNTIPIYGNSPPRELLPEEEFPDGFESLEEWDSHKCSVANTIFDGVIYTLAFLASLDTASITTLGVLIVAGVAGVLVFPPAALAVMVGAIAALFGFMGLLIQIREEMINRREEFVCVMYEAESVSVAIGLLADLMDVVIALVTATGPLGLAIKTVLLLLFNGDALNQLFDNTAEYLYPDADCSDCGPELVVAILNNSVICEVTEIEPLLWTVSSVYAPTVDRHEAVFGFYTNEGLTSFTGPMQISNISVSSGAVGGDTHGIAYHRLFNQASVQIYSGDANPIDHCAAYWAVSSEFEFELELIVVEDCV